MDFEALLVFYNKIMYCENEKDLDEIETEVKEAILNKEIIDNKDIVILNLAIQVKNNYFLTNALSELTGNTIIMIMGSGSEIFDPEEMHLNEFKKQEFEEFKDGNVISINSFNKKKK